MDTKERLDKFLSTKVISQRGLAEEVGIPQPTLSRFLAGTADLPDDRKEALGAALTEMGADLYPKLEALLAERAFKEFPQPRSGDEGMMHKRNWARHYPGEPCRSNQQDGIQVVVTVHQFRLELDKYSRPTVSIDVCGADEHDLWFKLECYTLREPDLHRFDEVIDRLVRAWNTLHQPETVQ